MVILTVSAKDTAGNPATAYSLQAPEPFSIDASTGVVSASETPTQKVDLVVGITYQDGSTDSLTIPCEAYTTT